MPVTKTAKKALRQARRRKVVNQRTRDEYKSAIKAARVKKTKVAMGVAMAAIDRAVKKKLIHKNKAARLKSRLAQFVKKVAPPSKPPTKKSSRK